jgi:hypothetical protein
MNPIKKKIISCTFEYENVAILYEGGDIDGVVFDSQDN